MKRFKLYATLWLVCLFCTGAIANAQTRIDVSPAGSLNAKLGNDKNTIENLVLSGSLNGDDIKTIRQMTKLRILNLEDASIVSGGSQYYPESGCNTEDNVIGQKMFYNMNRLVSLRLPKNITRIGDYALQNCINLSDVNIPEGVTSIGSYTYGGCENLTSITIPNTIENMGSDMFNQCVKLETVIFPNTVSNNIYMANLFVGCISLKNIKLPSNLKVIPSGFFSGCSSLDKIEIPETVTNISTSAFYGCYSLKSIQLPSNLNIIESYAFCNAGLISIIIPDKVESIGRNAFQNCTQLTSFTFPSNESFQIIENMTFSGCSALTALTIPNSITLIKGDSNPSDYEGAFANCTKLETIKMSNNLQGSIPARCFSNCSSLKEIIIPDGISKIERDAFNGCSSLIMAHFPSDLYSIGAAAFYNCKKLTNLTLPDRINSIGNNAFDGCESLGSITFPSTLRNIYGFSNTGLTKVILPEGIKKIEAGAFSGCHKLESIEFPSTLDSIKNNAFYECDALTSLTLPNNLTGLGEQAFANCHQLRNITIPASLDTIHYRTFNNCDSLRSVIIPDGIKRIKSLAFESCDSLESIILPTSLINIGAKAFANTNLKTVSVPEGITHLAGGVFLGCQKLKKVVLPSTLKKLQYEYNAEGNAGNWDETRGGVFQGCRQLSEITLPSGLTDIDTYTFYECSLLKSIILPAELVTIGPNAFHHTGLTQLTIPNKVTTIGESAFTQTSLNSIEIPASLTSIGESAFATPTNIESVIWNSSMSIPSNVFGYQSIKYLFIPNGIGIGNTNATYIIRNGIIDLFTPQAEQQYINDRYIRTYNMPKAFHALKATYTRNFSQASGNGTPAGWETIVLPYDVNKFTYKEWYGSDDEVEIAPFGSPALDTGARPFWLYEMTADGYRSATTIEAHKPYLICMPNNNMYPSSNNINGDVTFIGEDATNGVLISETEGKLSPVAGPSYNLVPTYQTVLKSDQVYKLNVGQSYGDNYEYRPGSVFVKNLGDIDPFQAYVTVNSPADKAPKFFSIGGNGGGITGMESLMLTPTESVKVHSNNGVIYIHSNAARTISIYDINGRTVYTLDANEGDNEVNGLPDGVYFLEGQKVMVRHK